MIASELRIGNYINGGGVLRKVISIDSDGCISEPINNTKVDYSKGIEPIPLTEEWLIKFGFELYANINNEYLKKNNIYFYGKGLICQLGEYKGIIVSVKYVHQLQNLYFALTGEELTIKEL